MAYEHTNKKGEKYYLHNTQVVLRGSGKTQSIYYFSRKAGTKAIDSVPQGFSVVESKRSGLPVLRKK